MVSNVKKVSKGSKFVKNVQGIKKGKNSAKGQSRRRVDIATSFSGRVTEKWYCNLKSVLIRIILLLLTTTVRNFTKKFERFFCRGKWVFQKVQNNAGLGNFLGIQN